MTRTQIITAVIVLAALALPVAARGPVPQAVGRHVEISSALAMKVMAWNAKTNRTVPLVAEHEIPDVTPEMITWWWDHIDNTERYQLWHPGDHIAFEWVTPPAAGHVGAIQKATEKIGGIPMALLIRWEDPRTVETDYQYVLAASIISEDGAVLMRFSHEYGPSPTGSRMRSTFHVPEGMWFIRSGLRKHNLEEMSRFPEFLPGLYREKALGKG